MRRLNTTTEMERCFILKFYNRSETRKSSEHFVKSLNIGHKCQRVAKDCVEKICSHGIVDGDGLCQIKYREN